ncbi:cytochrome c biogenesis protein CcsA [Balneicella halophila]|uniref:cytochrome c biogenesis protein CcsA n=1 Tax=Balneicella halophila TaxID=1537566 RepID=UPI000E2FF582|nr:cytochrome c biogenesis protein CcsA [Balneicella halophila]
MTWEHFIYFAIPSIILWALGAFFAYKKSGRVPSILLTILGLLVFFAFIAAFWQSLERPPLRTMGETRLWYSFFLPIAGLITYIRWRYPWILTFSTILATVFIFVNILKPEIHNKTLMPALQSPWFAPHVIVYMFSYAMLGAGALVSLYFLLFGRKQKIETKIMDLIDNFIYVGLAFLTIGMLFGALWAKEAWGHYWSWDPKETWAAATWMGYLVYVHYRNHKPLRYKNALCVVVFGFLLLQITWFGVNYLPSAQGLSIHTYSAE